MARQTEPGLLFGQEAQRAFHCGIDLMANLVRPTLGPTPRVVATASPYPNRAPDLLDDAATIMRRVVQIADPYADMGAMLVRHTAHQMQRRVGDGAATAAVLLQTLVRQAAPYLAAGGNAPALLNDLERGLDLALAAMEAQAMPLEGPQAIARVAETMCHDPELAELLGEIFDIVGPEGYVQVENGHSTRLERQYVEGVHWYEGYLSAHFVTDTARQETRLDHPAVLISDLELTREVQLLPLLERLAATGQRNLLVIAGQVSGGALSLLVANHLAGAMRSLAVRAPGYGAHQAGILEDLAVLTGGQVVTQTTGERIEELPLECLGHARAAWANVSAFGLLGGRGSPVALRQQIRRLRSELAACDQAGERDRLRQRLGRLLGGTAILQVGAPTRSALELRRARAERAVAALRLALSSGVVPGAGSAYLACQRALRRTEVPPAVGLRILARALEEPLRTIATNAGLEPATVVARVRRAPPGWGFDVHANQPVDLARSGILDPLVVSSMALRTAVSGAAMALSTEVLVHQRRPRMVFEP